MAARDRSSDPAAKKARAAAKLANFKAVQERLKEDAAQRRASAAAASRNSRGGMAAVDRPWNAGRGGRQGQR
jgi:hypothetical protein